MNAIPAGVLKVRKDTDILIEVILHFDPNAADGPTSVYRKVRAKLFASGWSEHRFNAAVLELRSNGRLFLSRSRKTISLKPVVSHKHLEKPRCVYCRKVTKNLTKDHVVPKAKGGTKCASNIVMACRPCNLAKADRTPAEWARDILEFRKCAS